MIRETRTNKVVSGRSLTSVLIMLCVVSALLLHGSAFAQTVIINKAWLSANGPSPYYLDQAGATYMLDTDVSTPGSAFAVIAPNISFDLNGHTITYDNSPFITVPNSSFEEGSGRNLPNWDLSQAPSADVGQGPFSGSLAWTGPQALRFAVPAGETSPDQQQVSALGTVSLAANTTYDLSFRAFNGFSDGEKITLYAKLAGTDIEAAHTGGTWRGFHFVTASFTTGSSPETHTIQLGIRAARSALAKSGYVYIDDIRIQRSRVFGVLAGPASWGEDWRQRTYPDITRFGSAANLVLKNGTISQGRGGGNRSHAVYEFGADKIEVTKLTTNVHGPNCHNFGAYYASGVRIHENTFYNNVNIITSRDRFDGTVISAGKDGEVYNNTIVGGCQNGIVASRNSKIHHNTIRLRSRYTNGFAIQLYGDQGSEVHDNTILCGADEWSCRGIFVGGGARGTRILNNQIEVQELPLNQEYNGGQGGALSGAYGIQVENANDIQISGNFVSAYAREWTASAFRMNAELDNRNIHVHDNTFRGIKMGRGAFGSNDQNLLTANSVKISSGVDSPTAQLRFERNTLVTNSRWIACTNISNLDLKDSTFQISGELLDPFQPLTAVRYSSGSLNAVVDLRFIDVRFADSAARSAFMEASIYKKYYVDFGIDPYSSFRLSWTLTLKVVNREGQPLMGATVRVVDSYGQEVFLGAADAAGEVTAVIDQFRNVGGKRTPTGALLAHTVTVTGQGFESVQHQVTMDSPQTLTVVLGTDKVAPSAPRQLRLTR
ncbi:MAG: hypothetical protein GX589_11235 [Deltaproteobacteria bacterium]|nr:hypothetical protein [Deltaproteobacteria bacterium]